MRAACKLGVYVVASTWRRTWLCGVDMGCFGEVLDCVCCVDEVARAVVGIGVVGWVLHVGHDGDTSCCTRAPLASERRAGREWIIMYYH